MEIGLDVFGKQTCLNTTPIRSFDLRYFPLLVPIFSLFHW